VCLFFSDFPICNLEPVQPAAFDASHLQGVTAMLLTSLMNLTFIGDEKLASNPLFPRPPSPTKDTSDVDGHRKSVELDSERLEKQLDEDMAQALAEDVAADDHNADKKLGTGAQTDGFDGTVVQTGSHAVKSQSNNALSLSSVGVREEHDHDTGVNSTSQPVPGLYFCCR